MLWVFKLSFVVDILAFLTWRLLGLFFKKCCNFFSSHLVTLTEIYLIRFIRGRQPGAVRRHRPVPTRHSGFRFSGVESDRNSRSVSGSGDVVGETEASGRSHLETDRKGAFFKLLSWTRSERGCGSRQKVICQNVKGERQNISERERERWRRKQRESDGGRKIEIRESETWR